MHPVKSIRKGNILVDKTPIVYSWWFKDSAAKKLLNKLGDYISWQDVCKTTLKGECYFLLYIGKGKNGHTRLVEYHILDKSDFHTKGIKNGRKIFSRPGLTCTFPSLTSFFSTIKSEKSRRIRLKSTFPVAK